MILSKFDNRETKTLRVMIFFKSGARVTATERARSDRVLTCSDLHGLKA